MEIESDKESALWLQNSGTRPTKEAIVQDVNDALAYGNGTLSEPDALAWFAWMAGLVEYGLLPMADFEEVRQLLPQFEVETTLQKFLNPQQPSQNRLSSLTDFDSTFAELGTKIEQDFISLGGTLPTLNNVAWRAYMAGLIEFGVVLLKHQAALVDQFLPRAFENQDDDPVYRMLFGRE